MFDFISNLISNLGEEEIDPLHEKLMETTCQILETDIIVMQDYIEWLEEKIRAAQRVQINDSGIRNLFFLENKYNGRDPGTGISFWINRHRSDNINFKIPRELPMRYMIILSCETEKVSQKRGTWNYYLKNIDTEKKVKLKISTQVKNNFNQIMINLQENILSGLF